MNEFSNITFARYNTDPRTGSLCSISFQTDNDPRTNKSVPLDPANRHYAEIMELVEAGELTIAPANEE